jgi:hypothetical protein
MPAHELAERFLRVVFDEAAQQREIINILYSPAPLHLDMSAEQSKLTEFKKI